MEITQELFEQQRARRFGVSNPERMQLVFWEWMIRSGEGPYRARQMFNVTDVCDGPIWTFSRMGATETQLQDGRVISIGGEHEDFYDPDFCICNDVIVRRQEDRTEIYGYPEHIFPPTDFHTATLLDGRIVVVGCLGYQSSRRPGHTPVYLLDLVDYHISEVTTAGDNPGWIFKHEAELEADGVIRVRRGQVVHANGDGQRYRRNLEEYTLDTKSWTWGRATHRHWQQFWIRQEGVGAFVLDGRPKPEKILPCGVDYVRAKCDEWNGVRVIIKGVPVLLTVGVAFIELIIEGDLPAEECSRLAEEIRENAEAATGKRCVFD